MQIELNCNEQLNLISISLYSKIVLRFNRIQLKRNDIQIGG
jgi:hypothetical protein